MIKLKIGLLFKYISFRGCFFGRCNLSYFGFFYILSPLVLIWLAAPWVRPTKLEQEEIGMTFQFKFSKINEPYMNISAGDLEKARTEVSNAGFELFEIWEHKDTHSHEVWKNSNTSECIRLNIIPENQDDQVNSPQDASRQEVVDELVDLWGELRAIRNYLAPNFAEYDDIEEDDLYIIQKPPSPLEKFWQKVAEAKVMIEEDQEGWDFLIKDVVDATVFAYYDLPQADRNAIVH